MCSSDLSERDPVGGGVGGHWAYLPSTSRHGNTSHSFISAAVFHLSTADEKPFKHAVVIGPVVSFSGQSGRSV